MTENEFLLQDRIAKIKAINKQYDLEKNAYIAFSGGQDSCCLELIDMALPGNNIPRLYVNTGIEYKLMVDYVKRRAEIDNRIIIIQPKVPITKMLQEEGYPFKSKEFSQKLNMYQRLGWTKTTLDYLGKGDKKTFLCPEKLKPLFSDKFTLKISDHCCTKLKKEPSDLWAKEKNRSIRLTGMRKSELGLRTNLQCTVFSGSSLSKFHPLTPVTEQFVKWFLQFRNVELCKLYDQPFNFQRTGCVCCPFSAKLKKELEVLEESLPNEAKRAELIWKPVYKIYRELNYRLSEKNKMI